MKSPGVPVSLVIAVIASDSAGAVVSIVTVKLLVETTLWVPKLSVIRAVMA